MPSPVMYHCCEWVASLASGALAPLLLHPPTQLLAPFAELALAILSWRPTRLGTFALSQRNECSAVRLTMPLLRNGDRGLRIR